MAHVTPHFGWHTPVLAEEADVPKDMLTLAEEIEDTVHELNVEELKNAGAGDAGKLLVVGPGGINAWKAMSGDATFSSAGALTIGNEKISTLKLAALAVTEAILAGEAVSEAKIKALAVTAAKLAAASVEESKIKNLAVSTAKLAELCVTEGKIADAAVTSRKHKPSTGVKQGTAEFLALTEAYQDIAGTTLEITPATASYLRIWATFGFSIQHLFASVRTGEAFGICNLDGVDQLAQYAHCGQVGQGTHLGSHPMQTILSLSAAKHTIKLRSKIVIGGAGEGTPAGGCWGFRTHYMYDLVSQ